MVSPKFPNVSRKGTGTYLRYNDIIKDIQNVQQRLEIEFINRVEDFSQSFTHDASQNDEQIVEQLNAFSGEAANQMFFQWKDLSQKLLVKYIDGNIKKGEDFNFETTGTRPGQSAFPNQPEYPEWWYRYIIDHHGSTIKVPNQK